MLAAAGMPSDGDPASALRLILESDGWWQNADYVSVLRPLLTRLCAFYLTELRDGKGPGDPVARFHLGNGARLESINWLGNTAPRAMTAVRHDGQLSL